MRLIIINFPKHIESAFVAVIDRMYAMIINLNIF